jgi:hypothetical protein
MPAEEFNAAIREVSDQDFSEVRRAESRELGCRFIEAGG